MGEGTLRVIYLCSEYPPFPHGGIGVFVSGLAGQLAASGHEVVVVGISPYVNQRTDEVHDGVRVIRLPPSRLNAADAVLSARKLRRELRVLLDHPRVVIEGSELSMWALPSNWSNRSIVRLHGGHRFFMDAEGRPTKVARSAIERRSLRYPTRIVGVSRYVADRTAQLVGLDATRISVIPNGVDVESFRPAPDTQAEPDTIGFVGTLCEKKGLRHLLRAVEVLHSEGRSVRVLLAGRDIGSSSGSGTYLDDVLRELSPSVRDGVEHLGRVPHEQIPAVFARSSVVALPSIMEAHPIAWLEAMACGRAVLASSRGPGPEVIRDGIDGLLREPTDVEGLAEGLRTLLDVPELADALGRAARQRVLDNFSLDRTTTLNVDLYQEVAAHAST